MLKNVQWYRKDPDSVSLITRYFMLKDVIESGLSNCNSLGLSFWVDPTSRHQVYVLPLWLLVSCLYFSFFFMCLCVSLLTCMCLCRHTCVWRPAVNTGYHSTRVVYHFCETGSPRSGAYYSNLTYSPRDLPVSFCLGAWQANIRSHTCMDHFIHWAISLVLLLLFFFCVFSHHPCLLY